MIRVSFKISLLLCGFFFFACSEGELGPSDLLESDGSEVSGNTQDTSSPDGGEIQSPIQAYGFVFDHHLMASTPDTSCSFRRFRRTGPKYLHCGGEGDYGQNTNYSLTSLPYTEVVVSGNGNYKYLTHLSGGETHFCGIGESNKVFCWGHGKLGRLGNGETQNFSHPKEIDMSETGFDNDFVHVSAGFTHSCGVHRKGYIFCWGDNAYGQIGHANLDQNFLKPALIEMGSTDASHAFVHVTAGHDYTCAIHESLNAYCWGRGNEGQLGLGSMVSRQHPQKVRLSGKLVRKLVAGDQQTCAISVGGKLMCWGVMKNKRISDGVEKDLVLLPTPKDMPEGLENNFIQIDVGLDHNCVIHFNGNAYCWGAKDSFDSQALP